MDTKLIIIIGLSILSLLFIILYITSKIKYYRLNKQYINDNKLFIKAKTKISMLEYYYRNFKEGMNPFTVLRDISNTLDNEEEDLDEHI